MLSVEENAALTSVGPGTPTGDLMRYWQPIAVSSQPTKNHSQPTKNHEKWVDRVVGTLEGPDIEAQSDEARGEHEHDGDDDLAEADDQEGHLPATT